MGTMMVITYILAYFVDNKQQTMTGAQNYIKAIKAYKEMGCGIDEAIVLAEHVLLEVEEVQLKKAYNIGYKDAQANHINDADQYYEQLKLK